MSDFDFDLLAEIAEQAPTAGRSFNYTNYGRTWMDNLQTSSWDNDTRMFTKTPYTGGQIPQGSTLEFQLHQEIEKQDKDTFIKTWYIQVKENGKRAKTDWGTFIKPSALKVFASLSAFFKAMNGKGVYCAIEDYDTGRDREDKNGKIDDATGEVKKYPVTCPKFIETFKNKSESDKAKAARFAKDALPNGAVPLGVINTFKATLSTLGETTEKGLKEMYVQFPETFEGYPIDDVVRESGLK